MQWTDNLPPQQVPALKEAGEVTVETTPSTDYWYLALNERRKPHDDANVRRAVAVRPGPEAITKAAKFGQATANQTAIPRAAPGTTTTRRTGTIPTRPGGCSAGPASRAAP